MKEFNELLKELGLTRRYLAKEIGLKYESMGVLLNSKKPLPKWAKSMLLVYKQLKNLDS